MRRLGIAEALREAIGQEMRRDQRVFCIGEDIAVCGGWGGAFTVTLGLEKEFGERMVNTPISENGFFGVGAGRGDDGATADRRRAVFRLHSAGHGSGGEPDRQDALHVGREADGAAGDAGAGGRDGPGAQHAQCVEPYLLPAAGLKIVCPATAYDAVGLLRGRSLRRSGADVRAQAALRLEGGRAETGTVDASSDIPDEDYTVPIGKAACSPRRQRRDGDRHVADDAPQPAGRRNSLEKRASASR